MIATLIGTAAGSALLFTWLWRPTEQKRVKRARARWVRAKLAEAWTRADD
jgi:hypothetical protein